MAGDTEKNEGAGIDPEPTISSTATEIVDPDAPYSQLDWERDVS